jgi:putative salt-induced outer membrane protein YdiY/small nuclear ribonucleoprotein (snRNP)-like protein
MRLFKYIGVSLFFLLFCVSVSVTWADEIELKNGDRITGKVIKKDDKNLTIKSDKFGVIVTPWDQVKSVVIENPVNIVTRDGRTVQGTLTVSEEKVEVTTPQNKFNVPAADISAIRDDDEEKAYQRMLNPGWGELWTGTGTIGLAGTAGNAKTLTFTSSVKANRETKKDKTALYFNFIKASARIDDVNEDTAEAVRGGISYGHNVNSRLFFNVFNDYEYDRFQNLDLRFVIGGGSGFQVLKSDRNRLDLVAGGAYNRSSFSTPLVRKSGEFYWGNDYSLKVNSSTSLIQSFRMFNDLTNTGTYRVNFDIGLSTKLMKWLSWNVSLSDRYLSDPAPDRKTNDFLYTTGFGITFSDISF